MTEIENETERNRQRIIRNYAQGYAGDSDEEERKFVQNCFIFLSKK